MEPGGRRGGGGGGPGILLPEAKGGTEGTEGMVIESIGGGVGFGTEEEEEERGKLWLIIKSSEYLETLFKI